MHITLVVKILGPHGGTEEYVRAVGQALMEHGHQMSCLYEEATPPHGEAWAQFLGRVNSARLVGSGHDRARTLSTHLSVHRTDVLYVHSASFTAEMYNVAVGSAVLVRFVHDFRPVCLRVAKVFPLSRRNCTRPLGHACLLHGCSIGPSRKGVSPVSWNRLGAKLAEREICQRFDRIIVASGFMRELLLRNGFVAERLSINPLFCDSDTPAVSAPLPEKHHLAYVGQLQRFKGLSVLLSAMRYLPSTLSLTVAGDGPWRSRFEAMASKWGLGDRVHFRGWVEREGLAAVLNQATVVVVPSVWNEPFGLVGLEALAHGRPVVAFDVGGISEWLEDGVNGVLVPEVGGKSLAAAVAELLAEPGRAARLGAAGRRQAQAKFSLERHVNQLLAEFRLPLTTMMASVS